MRERPWHASLLLIAAGADVSSQDKTTNNRPMDTARLLGHPEIADLLRKHGGKKGEELKAEGK